MASDSIPRSLTEPLPRQGVRDLAEQRMACRVASPQGVEPDATGVEIDRGADQPVRPRGVDLETMSEYPDGPLRCSPSQGDETATRMCLKVQRPICGKRSPRRRRLD